MRLIITPYPLHFYGNHTFISVVLRLNHTFESVVWVGQAAFAS